MIEFQRQTSIVHDVRELRAAYPDRSLDWALGKLGVSRASYFRFEKHVKQGTACVKDRAPGGRPRKFQLAPEETLKLRSLVAIYDSIDYAVEQFASTAECSGETRELILDELDKAARRGVKPRWPDSLRRAARCTPAERAVLRGSKQVDAISLAPRKGMFWRDEEGKDHLIRSHTAWMMDDYSTNQPYVIEGSQGQRLCRQMLVCNDLYSGAWLGVEAIGRERDAYRAEDILRFILHCIDAHGTMPETLILERGRWDSIAIHGVEVWDGKRHVSWGGLDDIMNIRHGYSPRHKAALESNLNPLQRALAHTGTDIGRHRGEFEGATRAYLAVQQGRRDATRNGFLTQDEALALHAQKMDELNRRPKSREAFDRPMVPLDLLADAITPRPLPDEHRWRFLPIKREATIRRGGLVEVSVKDYPRSFIFAVNGVKPEIALENGYAVLIAFDPARPDHGCVVANAEMGPKNRHHYGFGQILLTAPHFEDVPQWSDAPHAGASIKARSAAAHRAGFAGVRKHLRETPLRITQAHDGAGTVRRASNRPEAAMIEQDPAEAPRKSRKSVDMEALLRREAAALGETSDHFAGQPGD